VWLAGEHDMWSKIAIRSVIDCVADLDHGDVQVDLSGVTFMDASVIGALIGARNHLRAHGQSLFVRAPSAIAVWVLDLCHSTDLVGVAHPAGLAAPALGTWVDVPRQSSKTADAAESKLAPAVVRGRS
jgi:anti-anti-sigma factor